MGVLNFFVRSAEDGKVLSPTVFKLGMSRDYVHHWGVLEACRELLQNALDSQAHFEYTWNHDVDTDTWELRLISRNTQLPRSTMLLGNSGKRGDVATIGKYGEGYKLAMLVLLREGYDVIFHNAGMMWWPEFVHDDALDTEVFAICETVGHESNDLIVAINGISNDVRETLIEQCIPLMEPRYAAGTETIYGTILNLLPGKLFVGGLYICDVNTLYGYNIKPEYITLERDRRAVAGWELNDITMKMWVEAGNWDMIAHMMSAGAEDVAWADVYMNARIKDACYNVFKARHPNGIPVTSQEELERLVKRGFTETVYVGVNYYTAITQSAAYPSEHRRLAKKASPEEFVLAWIEQNKRYMNRYGQKALAELAEASRKWKA